MMVWRHHRGLLNHLYGGEIIIIIIIKDMGHTKG